MKPFILIIILLVLSSTLVYSQCDCGVGTPSAAYSPLVVGGTTNIGIVQENTLRTSLFYRYGFGNNDYKGDSRTYEVSIKDYYSNYIGFNAGYQFFKDFMGELELGFYPLINQKMYGETWRSTGFSTLNILGKYNFLFLPIEEFEITAGAGVKIPLQPAKDIGFVHKNAQTSTGAFGLIVNVFIHQGFSDDGLHFFLINRLEFNDVNNKEYKYGDAYYTSLYGISTITDQLAGILEIRNEYWNNDMYKGKKRESSGGYTFILAPQLNYNFGEFNVSLLFNYPFYQYLNGSQLAQKFTASLNFNWNIGLE